MASAGGTKELGKQLCNALQAASSWSSWPTHPMVCFSLPFSAVVFDLDAAAFSSDEFRIYQFKVGGLYTGFDLEGIWGSQADGICQVAGTTTARLCCGGLHSW